MSLVAALGLMLTIVQGSDSSKAGVGLHASAGHLWPPLAQVCNWSISLDHLECKQIMMDILAQMGYAHLQQVDVSAEGFRINLIPTLFS